jgi:hypothetical protein
VGVYLSSLEYTEVQQFNLTSLDAFLEDDPGKVQEPA